MAERPRIRKVEVSVPRSIRRWLATSLVMLSAACTRTLDLPAPPGPLAPGLVYGTVVYTRPGRQQPEPARGATVALSSTGLTATADAEGNFLLEGLTQKEGTLLFRFDSDGDGVVDRQRWVQLQEIGAGPGRQISLGQLSLGRNAQIYGRVLRADQTEHPSGHAGTAVFVPGGPFITFTGDDGTYLLSELPEGQLTVSVMRAGYVAATLNDLTLRSGESLQLSEVVLSIQEGPATTGALTGTVILQPAPESLAGTSVTAVDGATTLSALTDEQGQYRLESVPLGRYDLVISRDGYSTVVSNNVLMADSGDSQVPAVTLTQPSSEAAATETVGTVLNPADGGRQTGNAHCPTAGYGPNQPPVARISFSHVAPLGEYFAFDARYSSDPECSPLVYEWTQLDGTGVVLSANHSLLAATPRFLVPASTVPIKFQLVVIDEQGVRSAPVLTQVSVTQRPTAVISPAQVTVMPNQALVLDGRGSTDPSGAPLTYRWRLAQGWGTLSSLEGPNPTFTAPATSATSQVELVVSNGFLDSAPAVATIDITTQSTPFAADAGPNLVVGSGSMVNLTGSVVTAAPNPTDLFTYSWYVESQQPFGVPVALTPAFGPTTSFNAPDLESQLVLRLNVSRANNGGGMADARVTVLVQDLTPPAITMSEPAMMTGATGSPWFAGYQFNEPVVVPSGAVTVLDENLVQVPATVSYDPTMNGLMIEYDRPLQAGASYSIELDGITDDSLQKNAFPPLTHTFVARSLSWSETSSSPVMTTQPHPGIASLDYGGTVVVGTTTDFSCGTPPCPWAASTYMPPPPDGGTYLPPDDGGTYFPPDGGPYLPPDDGGTYFPPDGGMGPPTGGLVYEYLGPTTFPLSNQYLPSTRRAVVAHHRLYAQFGVKNLDPSLVMSRGQYGNWKTIQSPLGTIFSDGNTLYTVYVTGTSSNELRLGYYNPSDDSWTPEASGELIATATSFDALTPVGVASNGLITVAALTSGGLVNVYQKASTWIQLGGTLNTNPDATSLRLAMVDGSPFVVARRTGAVPQVLTGYYWTNGSWQLYPDVAGGVPGHFDLVSRGKTLFLAVSVGTQLQLSTLDVTGGTSFQLLPGPPGQGNSLNQSLGCTADHPELDAAFDRLWVTWAEECYPGSWTIQLRQAE